MPIEYLSLAFIPRSLGVFVLFDEHILFVLIVFFENGSLVSPLLGGLFFVEFNNVFAFPYVILSEIKSDFISLGIIQLLKLLVKDVFHH